MLLGSALFVLCLGLLPGGTHARSPAQNTAQNLGPGFGQRYLVLATLRVSTLQNELRQASAAGYRVVAAWSTNELVLLLEKTAAPPATYEYLVVDTMRYSTLEKDVKYAAARGYRVVPGTLIGEKTLIMEKAPGSSARYDYLFLRHEFVPVPSSATTVTTSLENISLKAALQGYGVAAVACATSSAGRLGHIFVLEKSLQPDAANSPQAARPSGRERYLLVMGKAGADLQDLLRRSAAKGYRLAITSNDACTETVLVLEDTGRPNEPYEYAVVGAQDQVSAASADGFHAHPSGVLPAFGILMERPPGANSPTEYFLVDLGNSSGLQQRLIDAAAQGMRVVAARGDIAVVRKEATAASGPRDVGDTPPGSPTSGALVEERPRAGSIPPGARIFVQEIDGFGTFMVSALKKKNVQVVVLISPQNAEFAISGTAFVREPSKTIAILDAIGELSTPVGEQVGDFPKKLEVRIAVRNVRTGEVVFEHLVQKRSTTRGMLHYTQDAADECAEQLAKRIQGSKPQ
ncbi:MAG: hypothetical protein ACM3NQ_05905 [Bacteroidales bacterium]